MRLGLRKRLLETLTLIDNFRQSKLILPTPQVLTGLQHHEFCDRDDQTGFFSNGYKRSGIQETQLGMMPANQGFEPHDAGGFDFNDWLVVVFKLTVVDGFAQIGLTLQQVLSLLVHFAVEDFELSATVFFGVVHGRIGVSNDRFGMIVCLGIQHHAQAGRGENFFSVDHERSFQSFLDSFRHRSGVFFAFDIFEQNDELIAAEPSQGIDLSEGLFDSIRKSLQQTVARRVPQAVVDQFESIDVEIQHGKKRVGATFGALDGHGQMFREQCAVRQIGQGVMKGLMKDLVLSFF